MPYLETFPVVVAILEQILLRAVCVVGIFFSALAVMTWSAANIYKGRE